MSADRYLRDVLLSMPLDLMRWLKPLTVVAPRRAPVAGFRFAALLPLNCLLIEQWLPSSHHFWTSLGVNCAAGGLCGFLNQVGAERLADIRKGRLQTPPLVCGAAFVLGACQLGFHRQFMLSNSWVTTSATGLVSSVLALQAARAAALLLFILWK